ncbi:MAG: nucleotidyl transferase AbiEii/AbiGii toxin family protein [Bacilli bacterium]|nr:nucleotidyl transferase AbiEii/AbiGii toxin family protein [Bacilli bacterium]
MNSVFEIMLNKYQPKDNSERENAIKEIVQEIVLSGLSRGGFFDKAVFYGGTCLRIFHGLNRFSEDLDFALLNKDEDFKIEDYFPAIKKELISYGLDMDVVKKEKSKDNNDIQSAFVKGNTQILLMTFFPNNNEVDNVIKDQTIKIKFEIDTDNPEGGVVETKYRLLPAPYEVKVFDEPTLFAGKIHAILCREYKNRIKGRDYYDYLFYCAKGTKINLEYLENKLKNSNKISNDIKLDLPLLKKMLQERFTSVDYNLARKDVSSFITDQESLSLWSKELFLSTLDYLKL